MSTRMVIVSFPDGAGVTRPLGVLTERATGVVRRELTDFVDCGEADERSWHLGPVARDQDGLLQWIDITMLLPAAVRNVLFKIPWPTDGAPQLRRAPEAVHRAWTRHRSACPPSSGRFASGRSRAGSTTARPTGTACARRRPSCRRSSSSSSYPRRGSFVIPRRSSHSLASCWTSWPPVLARRMASSAS